MRTRALAVLVCGACFVVACESGEEAKPVSTFPGEDPFARQISGHVYQGTEPVEGALVRVDATSVVESDIALSQTSTAARTSATDAFGSYSVQFTPFIYDLTVRRDREVFVMRDVAGRYVEPPLGADAPVQGFRAHVVPTTVPPPTPGNAVAFFVSGPDARTIGGADGTLDVTFRRFDTIVTLHAVEYVASDGLAHAVRFGRAEFRVVDGEPSAPVVAMSDVTTTRTVTFEGALPAGFTTAALDVEIDFGLRTSAALAKRVALGQPLAIAVVPGAAYTVRGRATAAGAISDSGRFVFEPTIETIPVVFPGAVSAEAPIDDEVTSWKIAPLLDTGGTLAVRFSEGVIEHVLTPSSGDGPIVRVATDARATTVPDVTRMGLPHPVGAYAWTFEHFPTLPHIERLSGPDGRVVPGSWKSAPRALVLR